MAFEKWQLVTRILKSPRKQRGEFSAPPTSGPSCKKPSNASNPARVGTLLRREGLYSSHLVKWRKQLRLGELEKKRGPKAEPVSRKRVEQLEREVARLQRKLENAELIIDVQKKLSQLLSKDLQGEKS